VFRLKSINLDLNPALTGRVFLYPKNKKFEIKTKKDNNKNTNKT